MNVFSCARCARARARVRCLLPHFCPSSFCCHVPHLGCFGNLLLSPAPMSMSLAMLWLLSLLSLSVCGCDLRRRYGAFFSNASRMFRQLTLYVDCIQPHGFSPGVCVCVCAMFNRFCRLPFTRDSWQMSLIVLSVYRNQQTSKRSEQIKRNQENERFTVSVRMGQTPSDTPRAKLA